MPTNRRFRTKQRRAQYLGLTDDLRRILQHGRGFFDRGFFETPTIEILKQAWQEHGDDILAEWIEEHPGSRPFGWWLCVGVPKHGSRRTTEYFEREHRDHRDDLTLYGILHTETWPAMQEDQVVYLRRHGLLTTDEEISFSAASCGNTSL